MAPDFLYFLTFVNVTVPPLVVPAPVAGGSKSARKRAAVSGDNEGPKKKVKGKVRSKTTAPADVTAAAPLQAEAAPASADADAPVALRARAVHVHKYQRPVRSTRGKNSRAESPIY